MSDFPRRTVAAAWSVGLACTVASTGASALAFGEPGVRSALGQLFDVRIPLQVSDAERADQFDFRLVARDAYEPLGLQPPNLDVGAVRANVVSEDGVWWLQLSAPRRVNEPLLVLLVEARKGSTRLVRELTLMFEMPPAAKTAGPTVADVSATAVAPVGEAAAIAPTDAAAAGRNAYGPVAAGETLRGIAERVRPEPRYGIRRVMTALLLANPDAFAADRTPRAGAQLSVPSPREMLDLDADTIADTVGPGASAPQGPRRVSPVEPAVLRSAPGAAAPIETLQLSTGLSTTPMQTGEPFTKMRLALSLSADSLALLRAADDAAAVPATGAEDDLAAAQELDAVSTAAEQDEASDARDADGAGTAPAATGAPRADDGPASGGAWQWWLAFLAAAVALAAWRRRRARPRLDPDRPPAPAANEPAPAPPPPAAKAVTVRVVGGRLSTEATALQQRIGRLSTDVLGSGARRKLTLAEAYVDDGNLDLARQLLDELDSPSERRAAG